VTGERRTLSALLMCLLLIIGLILPLVSLSFLIGEELTRAYTALEGLAERAAKGESLLPDQWRQYPMIAAAIERLEEYERLTGKNVRAGLIENLADLGKLLLGELTSLATNVLVGVIELLFIPLCCFFFFRDGPLGGLGLAAGRPALLTGAAMGMLAYLPIPGVSLVWVPGALYLFFFSRPTPRQPSSARPAQLSLFSTMSSETSWLPAG
jgi:predicted PurR-regulated permease PerM